MILRSILFSLMVVLTTHPVAGALRSEPWLGQVAKDHWVAEEQLLYWQQAQPRKAQHAFFLVAAPFAQVQAIVQTELKKEGRFSFRSDQGDILRYDKFAGEAWWQLMLSRQPKLRQDLANKIKLPQLQKAEQQGAITAAEVLRSMQDAQQSLTWSMWDAPKSLQQAQPYLIAERKYSSGMLGRNKHQETVSVLDVTPYLGSSHTAIILSRNDNYPNPDYSLIKEITEFNVLSTPQASRFSQNVVPLALFERLRHALAPQETAVASNPSFWASPILDKPDAEPLRVVNSNAPEQAATRFDWESLPLPLEENIRPDPKHMLVLPNGDVIISANLYSRKAHSTSSLMYRLSLNNNAPQLSKIWQAQSNQQIRRLALAADGQELWFTFQQDYKLPTQLYRLNLSTAKIETRPLPPEPENAWINWQLTGRQNPVFYDIYEDYQRYSVQQWPDLLLRQSPKSPRAQFLKRLRPVLWEKSGSEWVQDSYGLAELDPATGTVKRSIALPDNEPAPWSPWALGAPNAGWIAVPYLSMRQTNKRYWGAYIVDLSRQSILFAADLGSEGDTMPAMARSANGRLLALGQQDPRHIGLWDIRSQQSPLRLATPYRSDLRSLAFSPDGLFLYALTSKGILRWALPAALHDASRQGSLPEQNNY